MSFQLEVAQAVYDELNNNISNLPEYRFNINNIINSAIIIVALNPTMKLYFGDIRNFSFQLYNVNTVGDELVYQQLKQNQEIVDFLRKDLKYIIINNEKYEIISIAINGTQQPQVDWVTTTLDGVDETSQVYMLNLEIQIMKEKING